MDKWNAQQFIIALDRYLTAREEAKDIPENLASRNLLAAEEARIYQLGYIKQGGTRD